MKSHDYVWILMCFISHSLFVYIWPCTYLTPHITAKWSKLCLKSDLPPRVPPSICGGHPGTLFIVVQYLPYESLWDSKSFMAGSWPVEELNSCRILSSKSLSCALAFADSMTKFTRFSSVAGSLPPPRFQASDLADRPALSCLQPLLPISRVATSRTRKLFKGSCNAQREGERERQRQRLYW